MIRYLINRAYARKQARLSVIRQHGYDWAAGILLRGGAEDEIEMHALYGIDTDIFDRGALDALHDWRKL